MFLSALLFVGTPLWAQQKKSPVVSDSYEYDFGTVEASRGSVCHAFTLQNRSKAAVRIGRALPSCECIQARYSAEPIQPGASVRVLVVFSPLKNEGKSYRHVTLLDDTNQPLAALTVKANVTAGAAQPTSYPFQDPSLAFDERVENLISLLTPQEKVGLMMNK